MRTSVWKCILGVVLTGTMLSCESPEATSYAKMVETPDELIGGPGALGMVGDYLLSNNKIRVIIQDKGWSRGFGVFGGGIIDADIVRPRGRDGSLPAGKDNFGEGFPVFFMKAFDVEDQRVRDENGEIIEVKGIEVINDGSNGEPAVIRTYANAGNFMTLMADVLDNAVDTTKIHFETDFILAPGDRHVKMVGRLVNNSGQTIELTRPLLANLLGIEEFDAPVGDVLLFGSGNHVFTPGGVTRNGREGDPKHAGFDLRYSVEESYITQAENGVELPALPGLVTDFLATHGDGVSYGFALADSERNYAWRNRDQYGRDPLVNVTKHSLVVPFIFSAFTGGFADVPPMELEGYAKWEYSRYFLVGDGDVQSIRDELFKIRGTSTAHFGGQVLDRTNGQPVHHASVLIYDSRGLPYSQVEVGHDGRFVADVEPGSYSWVVTGHGRMPYPAEDERSPELNGFEVALDDDGAKDAYALIRMPGTASVEVLVRDTEGRPLPAKVTFVSTYTLPERCEACAREGYDCLLECEPRSFLFDYSIGEHRRRSDLNWNDGTDGEYIEEVIYSDVKGLATTKMRPGTYDVYVSRGNEYDVVIQRGIELREGGYQALQAELVRSVVTTDYVGADLHIHSGNSLDASMPLLDRVATAAAEGLEIAVATDHNYVTDLQPSISALGLQEWLHSIVGVEVSTLEMGHFNAFPVEYYPGSASHFPYVDPCFEGRAYKSNETSFDWVECKPQKLFNAARELGKYQENGEYQTLVQVNHPRDSVLGYFSQYILHPYTMVPEEDPSPDNYSLAGFPLNVAPNNALTGQFLPENFSMDFDALEIFNGKRHDQVHAFKLPEGMPEDFYRSFQAFECEEDTGHPLNGPGKTLLRRGGHIAYPGAFEDWLNILNASYRCEPPPGEPNRCANLDFGPGTFKPITATGNSDSHGVEEEVGAPKNYVYVEPIDGVSRDLPPAGVHELELIESIKKHQVIVTNGPFINMRVRTAIYGGESGEYRDWRIGEMVLYGGNNAGREVEVLLEMRKANWIGVDELVVWANGEVLERIDVSDAGAQWISTRTYEFDVDTYLVLEALSSQTMFPMMPSNEDPPANVSDALDGLVGGLGLDIGSFGGGDGVSGPSPLQRAVPYAFTNPIWLDTDGDFIFTPPGNDLGPGPAPEPVAGAECGGETKSRVDEPRFDRRLLRKRASPRRYERADIRRIFDGLHDH